MTFDPNAPFEVLDAPGAPPAAAGGFDPNVPFEVVDAAPQPSAMRGLGLGARGVLAGAVDTLRNPAAAVLNAPSAIINDLAGRQVIPEPFSYDQGQSFADMLGLPRPASPTEQVLDRVVQGGAGMVGPMAGARAIQGGAAALGPIMRPATPGQAVVGALANSPGTDIAAGAVGGAAGGLIEQSGGGVLPQVAGDVTGNILTAAIIAAVARRRGLNPQAVRPESVTPDEQAAAWSDPDVRRLAEANGITDPADPRLSVLQPRVEAARAAEAERAAVPPSVTQADLRTAREAVDAGADPSTVAPPVRQPPPETIALPDQSNAIPRVLGAGGERITEPPLRGTPDPNAVPLDPTRLRSEDEAAAQAFRQAEAQRGEVAPGVRDTQPAPRPEGVNPQTVYLDQGFPVRVLGRDDQGFVSVERYDPRTGQPAEGAVPYVVREAQLQQRQYSVQPRAAQDFVARSESPRNPEMPREPGPGRPAQEPGQTFRATSPDANQDFPGAGSGRPPPDAQMGRSPFPDQPDGPAPGRRWSSAEDAERAFQARRAQADAEATRARESGEWNSGQRSTNQPGAQGADGRWPTGPGGYVASNAGGPIRFADQKQAARWIISQGQAKSPDQFFEIAVHPSGQGFTVREAGRNAGPGDGGNARGGAAPEGGAPPRSTPEQPGGPPRPAPEGEAPRALPAPQPDGSVRPAAAETTTRPLAAGVEGQPRLAQDQRPAPSGEPTSSARPADNSASPQRTNRPAEAAADDAGQSSAARGAGRTENTDGRLYANPLADPDAWKRFLVDPALSAARSLRNVLMSTVADVGRGVERVFRVIAHSKRAGMDWIARRYENIAEARMLRDMLATDPGTSRVVRETFQTAFETQHARMANRLRNIIGKNATDADMAKLRDDLLRRGGPITPQGKAVRKLLDEQHAYLTAAGIDLGYVKGRFFPRRYNTEAILQDPQAFIRDVEAFYRRRLGMSADEAAEAAADWMARLSGAGPAYGHSPMSAKHTKGRVLPAEADTDLARWLDTDSRSAIDDYLRSTSRLAEFTRRFGVNGKKADEMFRAMHDKGMAPQDVALMRHFFQGATGTLNGVNTGPLAAAADWVQAAGSAMLLSKAVLSSIVEGMAIGARTGNVWTGIKSTWDSWRLIFDGDHIGDARRAAEIMGVINTSLSDNAAAATAASADTMRAGSLPQRLTNSMFRRTGLSGLTERQQIAASRAGQTWIGSLLDDVLDGTRRQESAKRLLAELGMDEKDARAVGAWLRKNDGTPTVEMLMDGGREGAMYRAAVARFVRESIQNAQAVDRPLYAEHPLGRFAYGITSFMFAFARNVVLRSAKQAGEAVTAGGLTIEDRARLLGPMFGLTTLAMAQFGVGWARDNLLNPKGAAERDHWTKVTLAMDRTGLFGTASPLVNLVTSAKYQRHPATVLTGPYLSSFLDSAARMSTALTPQPMGPNSPRTNNAEHAAARAAYRAVLTPAVVMGLSALPGGPALSAAYGIGMVATSLPAASHAVADAVVGPRTVRGRQQRRTGPQPLR